MTDIRLSNGSLERTPPQDIQAEQSVLGGMLLSKDAIGDVISLGLKGPDFYRPAHETIYAAILDLYAAGEPADPITIAAELTKRGGLQRAGGSDYIHQLVDAVPTAANAEYYAEIVHERALQRRLAQAGERIAGMAYAAEGNLADLGDSAQAILSAATESAEDSHGAPIGDSFDQYIDELETIQRDGQAAGIPTGFADLDALTEGLHPGQMIIIAARPAMGKTQLALDFARSASIRHDRPTAFFSLEMGRVELMNRVISAQAQIAIHHMRRKGGMTDDDWLRLTRVTPRVTAAPLTIDDNPYQTVAQIKAKCRRLKQRAGLDLVIIDYLQLLQSGLRRTENRQVEVAEMSRQLKLMAKDLGVPVVVLAQLNRGPEQRADKKPMVSDLRESGSLEQDADLVILLHREDAYEKASPRAGEADLIVGKHRNGPTATITVAFQGHYSRFVDMTRDMAHE